MSRSRHVTYRRGGSSKRRRLVSLGLLCLQLPTEGTGIFATLAHSCGTSLTKFTKPVRFADSLTRCRARTNSSRLVVLWKHTCTAIPVGNGRLCSVIVCSTVARNAGACHCCEGQWDRTSDSRTEGQGGGNHIRGRKVAQGNVAGDFASPSGEEKMLVNSPPLSASESIPEFLPSMSTSWFSQVRGL